MHRFSYKWKLSEAHFTKDKGKVFSCFACGGGSTMGYKLAGYDVIGCNEIDRQMMKLYVANHNPKYSFLEPIQEFAEREDYPAELYDLDILDGSPPCSTFSIAGQREESWGKEKKFREGQQKQVLDTLFFDFIKLAKKLQPKVVVAENVKGILLGNAIEYVRKIHSEFDRAGYYCLHFLLNASQMGVPQRRERVFFICLRKDLAEPFLEYVDMFTQQPKLSLEFNEKPIPFGKFKDGKGRPIYPSLQRLWEHRQMGDRSLEQASMRVDKKSKFFNNHLVYDTGIVPTLTAKSCSLLLYDKPIFLSRQEILSASTFPEDYDFFGKLPNYVCGMSVPPVMMAQISREIYKQWLIKLN